jgi:hypothetical protein
MKTTRTKQIKVDASKLAVGSDVAIHVGGAACHTMVAVLMIFGTVLRETEKAVQIRVSNARAWKDGGEVTLWIPKSAIVEPPADEPHVAAYFAKHGRDFPPAWHLAKWFAFDSYGQRVLDRIEPGITAIAWPTKAA